jgi:hypothetical protein
MCETRHFEMQMKMFFLNFKTLLESLNKLKNWGDQWGGSHKLFLRPKLGGS